MVSFNGIDNLTVTMLGDGASVGKPCKMKTGKTVMDAASGDAFQGVCVWKREGLVGVQVKGFVTLPYTGTTAPTVGHGILVSNGNGGVTVPTVVSGGNGTDGTGGSGSSGSSSGSGSTATVSGLSRLIVDVDTTGKTVTFYI